MDTTDKIILLIAGIGFSLGIAFYLLRPKMSATTYKVVQTYENEETWNFTKDENGRVTGVTVHRKASES